MSRQLIRSAVVWLLVVPLLATCGAGSSPSAEGGAVTELPGTSWNLVELGGSVPAGDAKETLVFGADGTVHGNAGCNTFNGTPTIDGSTIRFGPLATTRMACPEPAMSVESAYLAGLAGATTWRIDRYQLLLEGATELRFDPV
jgi:heat shock protein HslJ